MIQVFEMLSSLQVTGIFKGGLLVVLALFIVFLFVILKQVISMNKIVTQPNLYPILLFMAWGLIALGLALFGLSVVIL